MQFNIKSTALQPTKGCLSVFVIDEKATLPQTSTLLKALSAELLANEGANLAHAKTLEGDNLAQVALLRLPANTLARKKVLAELGALSRAEQLNAVQVDVSALEMTSAAAVLLDSAIALADANYACDWKQDSKPAKDLVVTFVAGSLDVEVLQKSLEHAEALVYGIKLCKDLGNAPGNVCTPSYLANRAKREAEALGVEVKIHASDAIQALGMGAFWSVAKGSTEGAYLIELHYQGAVNKNEAPVVLVGKGITFDSGGISLKPGEGMDEMKYDMCGAASVLGAFCAAVRLKLPLNVSAIIPTCENMPAGNANKPGDVVKTMKGLSVEVLNTDAEGRLILCDALTFAERLKPQAVVNVATLTGACVIALGHTTSGLMSNNQALADQLLHAAQKTDDKAWQLPLFEEYKEQLKSNFADLQNIGTRAGGTITAGTFLSYFTEAYAWAHLDIAGTAWRSGKDKGATGRPVPLLLQFLRDFQGK